MVDKILGQTFRLDFTLTNQCNVDIPVYLYVAFSRNGSTANTPYANWWIGSRAAGFPGYNVPARGSFTKGDWFSTYQQWYTSFAEYFGPYDLEIKVVQAKPGLYELWNAGQNIGQFLESLPVLAEGKFPSILTIVPPEGWVEPPPDVSGP